MIFCGFMLLRFINEKYSEVLMMIMFLCIVALSVLRAYFSRERLRAYNNYSDILRHNSNIQRRLELIMMELENLPLETLAEEVIEPRNVSKELINTLPHILMVFCVNRKLLFYLALINFTRLVSIIGCSSRQSVLYARQELIRLNY